MQRPANANANEFANERAGFHPFRTGDEEGGTFEVFWEDNAKREWEGWYWWPRYRGLEPDNDALGPYNTSEEAYQAALASYSSS